MREYLVSIGSMNFEVRGFENAYKAFRKAKEFAEVVGGLVCVADAETGEILADNSGEE